MQSTPELLDTRFMRGSLRRGLLALGMVASVAGLATAWVGSVSAATPPSEVTVAEAQQVYATTWQKFGHAFAQGQLGALESLATPNVLDIVAASTGCGCSWDTPHSKVYFSIPPQQGYPESFLAQISTPAPRKSIYSPFVTMAVFTKAAAKKPWQVAYFVRYAGTGTYISHSVVAPAPPALFDITEVPGQIANFFTSMVTTGDPPPGDNWPQEGALADTLDDYLNTKADVTAGGDEQQTVFNALDHSIAFAYAKGDIMCATYDSTSTVSPAAGVTSIVQPEDQSEWGGQLAPGSYSTLSKLGMNDMCFSVDTMDDPHQSGVVPISFQGGVYQISGTPISLPAVPPISGSGLAGT
jgi:hypothetical protein